MVNDEILAGKIQPRRGNLLLLKGASHVPRHCLGKGGPYIALNPQNSENWNAKKVYRFLKNGG